MYINDQACQEARERQEFEAPPGLILHEREFKGFSASS
jgi:hypothetical protein